MNIFDSIFNHSHTYCLCSIGTKLKDRRFSSRKEAEAAMNYYCSKNNISIECIECDKHERCYSNHKGIRFFINRE